MSAAGGEPELVFLFTDIEGSTRLWERDSAAMPGALELHYRLIAEAVANHGGRIFKTAGDGVFAVFSEPLPALEAAINSQWALVYTDWSSLGLTRDLAVRMALHAGLAEERDGDFSGIALNRLSRLLGAGHGGQILISGALAESIGEPPPGIEFRDLGIRRLRDLPGPEKIVQLLAPGLPSTFPPLNALDPVEHNLPFPPTTCIDREDELNQLQTLFTRTDARLVTLTGPGGIGKTRLAIHAAFALLDSFPDGVWFVDLAPLQEESQVANAAIRAIGVPEHAGRDPEELLRDWLRDRRLLIVLDNCEHVMAGAARLAAGIGRDAPETHILATSRAPLGIRGERQISVEPLSLPAKERESDIAEVAASPSVQLFVARASEVRSSFTLTADNAGVVAAICQQVDGIPLALELAAARVSILSPEALQKRLDHRLPLLTTGARDLPARQQTLRNAIGWSYDLLLEPERVVFRRLAVFAGGATLGEIEGFLGASPADPLLETLSALVAHNRVRVDQDAVGEPRFSMLETIREFALEALEHAGETETWRDSHAGYFLALSYQAAPHLVGGPRQQEWMNRIDRDYLNLRAAALWWLDLQEGQNVLELCTNIWRYWSVRGGAREGIELIRRALAAGDEVPADLRAAALRRFGNLSISVGDTRAARALFEESMEIERAQNNILGIASCLGSLGVVATMQGRSEDFPLLLGESVSLFRTLGHTREEAIALFNEALGWRDYGDLDRAEKLHNDVIALQEVLNDDIGIGWSWLALGRIARDRGNLDQAAALASRALARFHEVSEEEPVASANEVIASIELARGNLPLARRLLQEALETHQSRNDMQKMAECFEGQALVEYRSGDRMQASMALNRSVHLREQSGCPVPRIDAPALEQLAREIAAAREQASMP